MTYELTLDELASSLMEHGIDINDLNITVVEEPNSVEDEHMEMTLPDQINRSNKHQLYMDNIERIRQKDLDLKASLREMKQFRTDWDED